MDGSGNGRVVVGLCDSVAAYQALRFAVVEARRRGASLIVVRAFPSHGPGEDSWRCELDDLAAREVHTVCAEVLGGMPAGVTMQVRTGEGTTGSVLVEAADRENDMLFIGGSSARRVPVGGAAVARFCARHAVCPVVIVPPPAMARRGAARRLVRSAIHGAEEHLTACS